MVDPKEAARLLEKVTEAATCVVLSHVDPSSGKVEEKTVLGPVEHRVLVGALEQAARRVTWVDAYDGIDHYAIVNGHVVAFVVVTSSNTARYSYRSDRRGHGKADSLDAAKAVVEKALNQSEGSDG